MLGAVVFGHEQMQAVIKLINELADEAGKPAWDWKPPVKDEALIDRMAQLAESDLRAGLSRSRQSRSARSRIDEICEARVRPSSASARRRPGRRTRSRQSDFATRSRRSCATRSSNGEPRIDGRDTRTVRPITIRTGVLPRAHGSALFTRGETQALVTATLGTSRDEQIIDALQGEYRERFMMHYNMPPYATGETGRVGSPKRREIGHGRLAKRALLAVLPTPEEFAYSLRVVSEITESNGSSSMASVCGGCLALMDAGRAAEGARGGHRDGAHQGRQPLRRADRHPRRRGPPGRHGLQGRRHRKRRDRAADGHQDPGHHQGDHARRARPGARRPHAHPGEDEAGARQRRAPSSRRTRRA